MNSSQTSASTKRKIYLIDGYNLIYRLFYAVPPFTTKAGEPVNAVFGMVKTLTGIHSYEKPDLLYFVSDAKGKTFREDIYPEYKGTRDRMPDDLKSQEDKIFRLLEAMEIPVLSVPGFEADDIIGTLAVHLKKDPQNEIYILSGDKDLYQFIGENVVVYDTMKRSIMRREQAIEKFGVGPEHVVDYLAITGDSSDNIPGISGFGPKKAQALITEFGTLEKIYEAVDTEHPSLTGKTLETLKNSRDVAFLSKKLASIDTNVDIKINTEGVEHQFSSKNLITEAAKDLFREFEFRSLLPNEEEKKKQFDTLGIVFSTIDSPDQLQALEIEILLTKKCAIATRLSQGLLAGVAVRVGEKLYFVDLAKVAGFEFLKNLLESEAEIIGYDLKEDVKMIWRYIENSQIQSSDQLGLVF